MSAPSYAQLVDALDRIVAAHYAETDERSSIADVLREIETSIAHGADLAVRGRASLSEPAGEAAKREARRLTEPTGQPPEPEPDAPAPAHARSRPRATP